MAACVEPGAVGPRLKAVIETINRAAVRVARDSDSIRLVLATKGVGIDRIAEAVSAGAAIMGENRLQEALPKIAALRERGLEPTWHFIGQLQRRKVKSVVGVFEMIHSVDSVDLANEIDRRARAAGLTQKVLLEVNIAGEKSKTGFDVERVEQALTALDRLSSLEIVGLMTIPPFSSDPEAARAPFRRLRELAQRLSVLDLERIRMTELSMGMSQDYGIAVEEGATIVRVGTAIFGPRTTEAGAHG